MKIAACAPDMRDWVCEDDVGRGNLPISSFNIFADWKAVMAPKSAKSEL